MTVELVVAVEGLVAVDHLERRPEVSSPVEN